MKFLFSSMIVFGLLSSQYAMAEELKARLQTQDKKVQNGVLVSRQAGSIDFRADGGQTVRVPIAQVAYLQFPINEEDDQQLTRLFNDGDYQKLAPWLDELLTQKMPYIDIPSNLTPNFMRWMIASYWSGGYDKTIEISKALERFGDVDNYKNKALFYRGLAQLEKGDYAAMEAFLASPAGSVIYPVDSVSRLYIDARIAQKNKQYTSAIRIASRIMALHSRDADWMPQAELLCAELYFQMKMPESAKSVLADITEFYSDPQIQKKAAAIAAIK
ncbi:MAG: tetratricopeptide repeat protein [Kiritimatiellaceae bacterium]|nr:tetratricopeptide repeat protein [Kiritimatiellaceae bacterium]